MEARDLAGDDAISLELGADANASARTGQAAAQWEQAIDPSTGQFDGDPQEVQLAVSAVCHRGPVLLRPSTM